MGSTAEFLTHASTHDTVQSQALLREKEAPALVMTMGQGGVTKKIGVYTAAGGLYKQVST